MATYATKKPADTGEVSAGSRFGIIF
jgi:hypothetical protein